jgi:hypothetical protein
LKPPEGAQSQTHLFRNLINDSEILVLTAKTLPQTGLPPQLHRGGELFQKVVKVLGAHP